MKEVEINIRTNRLILYAEELLTKIADLKMSTLVSDVKLNAQDMKQRRTEIEHRIRNGETRLNEMIPIFDEAIREIDAHL